MSLDKLTPSLEVQAALQNSAEPAPEIKITLPNEAQLSALCLSIKKASSIEGIRKWLWARNNNFTTETIANEQTANLFKESFVAPNIAGVQITLDDIIALTPTAAELAAFRATQNPTYPERIVSYIDSLNARIQTALTPKTTEEPQPPAKEAVIQTPSPIVDQPRTPEKPRNILTSAHPGMTLEELYAQQTKFAAPETLNTIADRAAKRTNVAKEILELDILPKEKNLFSRIEKLSNSETFRRKFQSKIIALDRKIAELRAGVNSDTAFALHKAIEEDIVFLEARITSRELQNSTLQTKLETKAARSNKDPEAGAIEDGINIKINRLTQAAAFREHCNEDLGLLAEAVLQIKPDTSADERKIYLKKIKDAASVIEKNINSLPRLEPAFTAKKKLSDTIARFAHRKIFREAYAAQLAALTAAEDGLYKELQSDSLKDKLATFIEEARGLSEQLIGAEQFEEIMDQFGEDASGIKNFLWKNKWGLTQEWFDARKAEHEIQGSARYAYIVARLKGTKTTPEEFREFLPTAEELKNADKNIPFKLAVRKKPQKTESSKDAKPEQKRDFKRPRGGKDDINEHISNAEKLLAAWWPKIGDVYKEDLKDFRSTLWSPRLKRGQKPSGPKSFGGTTEKLEPAQFEPYASAVPTPDVTPAYVDKFKAEKELGQALHERLDTLVQLYHTYQSDKEQFRAALVAAAQEKPSRIVPLNRDGNLHALAHKTRPASLEYLHAVLGDKYDNFVSMLPTWDEYNRRARSTPQKNQSGPLETPTN